MDDFSPSDLKTILHSKRANLYYLAACFTSQKPVKRTSISISR
jgi:CRISPR-associated protein Cas1